MNYQFKALLILLLVCGMQGLRAYTFTFTNGLSRPLRLHASITLAGCKDIDETFQGKETKPFNYTGWCGGACMGDVKVYDTNGNLLFTRGRHSLPGIVSGCKSFGALFTGGAVTITDW